MKSTFLSILLFTFIIISIALGISPDEIIQKTQNSYKNLSTFYSILEVYNRIGNNEDYIVYEFYFQKPDKIRLEVLEGKDKGTTIVYQNSRVRLKKGGVLSFIPLSLNIDDPLVLSIRKGRIDELGLSYIIDMITRYKAISIKESNFLGYNCYILEIGQSKDRLYNYSLQRIYIEKESFIPILLEQYENIGDQTILVHKRVYKNFKINIPLDSKLFEL